MFNGADEITIGNHKYMVDHSTHSIKRYNEEYKMWVRITFGCGNGDFTADDLIKMLTDEYIRQCLEKEKSPT